MKFNWKNEQGLGIQKKGNYIELTNVGRGAQTHMLIGKSQIKKHNGISLYTYLISHPK